jgi:acyl-coenzyme A synthetase/AMP-(fatty) acid ligase
MELNSRKMENSNPAIDLILSRMYGANLQPAVISNGKTYSYGDLISKINLWEARLTRDGLSRGSVCAFIGDFSIESSALIFALIKIKAILVPLTSELEFQKNTFIDISCAEFLYDFQLNKKITFSKIASSNNSDLINNFRDIGHPGLIVFSSGSTGEPKGILHDFELLIKKFTKIRKGWRTILFLLFDHFGGFNTFLATFANLGVAICPDKRTPASIAKLIQDSKAELLPTTPTFLNLMLASMTHKIYDLSSVKLITYGTELMSASTLDKVVVAFPDAKLKQTYGLSELGVLRSESKDLNTTWVRVGGDGFETKVIDGVLWVRSHSNMVGYINAPNPFDESGWMCTGDEVEIEGDCIKFLGRASEVINVGGKKVFPVEVESILLSAENIKDVTVYGVKHSIMGQIVVAKISLLNDEAFENLIERLRIFCNSKMAKYKVPVKFILESRDHLPYSHRYKKIRKNK